jgi:L-amino acid N-acyltransferase YncA
MMPIQFRFANILDLGSIDAIYNQAIEAGQRTADLTPWSQEQRLQWFHAHPEKSHPVYVCDLEGSVVGFATVSPYRCGRAALDGTAEVSMYLDNAHQGKGIGKQFLQFIEKDCSRLGIKNLFAIIIDSNLPSIRLMESQGYERWGHMPRIAVFGNEEVGHVYYGKRLNETGDSNHR